jgi:hypothetical protein
VRRRSIQFSIIVCLVLVLAPVSFGQNYNPFNQRDDEYRLLGLKRAKESYEVARAEYERKQELFRKKMITQAELDRAHNVFADAEVNYQQSLLAVLFEQQFVSVSKAVKYQADDGTKHVRLTLANTSGGSAEFRKLLNIEDELFRSLEPDVINNVYVSVLNDDGAIISSPYEAKIEELVFGAPQTLDFEMLQDLDAVTVDIIYSNGSERSLKIFLQKDATVNRVIVQSEQFSQEIELGGSSSFDLTLELFSGTRNPYSLVVVNLPEQIGRYFTDPGGQVRLRQVKFTESTQTKRAALALTMPDRPTDEVAMDQAIAFYVLVVPQEKMEQLGDAQSRQMSQAEIDSLDVGHVRLEVIPRGKGEILVRAPLLYHAINPGDRVETTIDLINEGTHRLDNITVDVDLPLRWRKEIEPLVIPSLAIGEDAQMHLTFIPADDVSEGKYDIRLRTTGMSNNEPVSGEDKTISVEIRAKANVIGTGIIILLLLGVVGGMVVFGIRLSRR